MNEDEFRKLLQKQTDENNAALEGIFGIRMVFAYQCIKCGKYYNDGIDCLEHSEACDGYENIKN